MFLRTRVTCIHYQWRYLSVNWRCLPILLSVQAQWKKITHFPICFEGRNNKPGHFMYVGDEIIVGALRLEWTSGTIRCVSDKAYDSRWGCHHHSSYRNYPFNVIVTDGKDSIIYPLPEYIKTSGLWWVLLYDVEIIYNYCSINFVILYVVGPERYSSSVQFELGTAFFNAELSWSKLFFNNFSKQVL